MKILLAILSCDKDRKLAQAQRETCLKDCPMDYRFFLGRLGLQINAFYPDEVYLDCGDGYTDLPFKTQRTCEWALANGYDYIFKGDTDTLVHVPRLMAAVPACDYSGFYRGDHTYPGGYASGGPGYWLSRRAMEIVVATQFVADFIDPACPEREYIKGEDLQVGHVLFNAGIVCKWDGRYTLDGQYPHPDNALITNHNVRFPNKGVHMLQKWQMVMEDFGL